MPRTRRRKINPPGALAFEGGPEVLARFFALARLDKATGCWIWQGHTDENGYGQFKSPTGQAVWAHRYSYAIAAGPIPAGEEIDHRDCCSSTSCINPAHLQRKTPLDNATDGGHRRHNGMAKKEIPI